MNEALHREPIRSRMAEVLKQVPFDPKSDTEIKRFSRMLPVLARSKSDQDLHEAVSTILAYEACYQLVTLSFERLLWLGRHLPAASIQSADIGADSVFKLFCDQLPAATKRLTAILDGSLTSQFQLNSDRLQDTRQFLEKAAVSCESPAALVRETMERHIEVQHGKFDRGRKKMPWLELTAGRISLTMTRVGGLKKQVTLPAEIAPHPYRLYSADAMISAAEVL